MAKFGKSATLALLKASELYDSVNSTVGHRIIFTDDGYVAVGDKVFRVPVATFDGNGNITNINGLTVSTEKGKLAVGIDGYTAPSLDILIGAEDGDYLTKTVTDGIVKFAHNKPAAASSDTAIGATFTGYELTTNSAKYDAWGHITGHSVGSATHVDYITDELGAGNKTYYLLGGEGTSANTTYYKPKKTTGVYMTTGADTTVTSLSVPSLYVTSATAGENIIFGTIGGTNNTTLKDYIDGRMTTNDAMLYIGIFTAATTLPSTNVVTSTSFTGVSDLSKLSKGATFKVSGNGYFGNRIVEAGDMIIVNTDNPGTDATKYDIVQSNLQNAVVNGNTINAQSGGVATGFTVDGLIVGANNNAIKTFAGATTATGSYLASTATGAVEWKNFTTLKIAANTDEAGNLYSPITTDAVLKFLDGNNAKVTVDGTTVKYDVTYTDTVFDLIVAKDATDTTTAPGTRLNLISTVNTITGESTSAQSEVVKSLLFKTTGDATISFLGTELTFGSTVYTANTNASALTLTNHAFSIGAATTSKWGAIKLATAQSTSTIAELTTAGASGVTSRIYDVRLDKDGKAYVDIPANTWRPIYAWKVSDLGKAGDTIDEVHTNLGTGALKFSSTFAYTDDGEIDLVWAEVDANGKVTYSV